MEDRHSYREGDVSEEARGMLLGLAYIKVEPAQNTLLLHLLLFAGLNSFAFQIDGQLQMTDGTSRDLLGRVGG